MHLDHFNSQYVPKHMLPLTLTTSPTSINSNGFGVTAPSGPSKSISVNDFTGSILAADRVSYYNRQQQKQMAAAAAAAAAAAQSGGHGHYYPHDKRSSSTAVIDSYSSRMKQPQTQQQQMNEAYIYLTQGPPPQPPPPPPPPLPPKGVAKLEHSFDTYRDAIINRKRSSSEKLNQISPPPPPPPPPELMYDIPGGGAGQNVVYINKQAVESGPRMCEFIYLFSIQLINTVVFYL